MAPRRRKGKLTLLGDLLPSIYPAREQAHALRLFSAWRQAVPKRVHANARPIRFDRGVLLVHVSSSAWAQELELMWTSLIGELRKAAPEVELRALRFRVGPLPPPTRPTVEQHLPVATVPLTELPDDVGRALARIKGDELRDVVASAALVSLGRPAREKARPSLPRPTHRRARSERNER